MVRVFNNSGDVNQGQGFVYGATLVLAYTQVGGRARGGGASRGIMRPPPRALAPHPSRVSAPCVRRAPQFTHLPPPNPTQCEGKLAYLQASQPDKKWRMVVSMSVGAPGPLTIEKLFFQ
jgi:hypothetical protein